MVRIAQFLAGTATAATFLQVQATDKFIDAAQSVNEVATQLPPIPSAKDALIAALIAAGSQLVIKALSKLIDRIGNKRAAKKAELTKPTDTVKTTSKKRNPRKKKV